MPNGKIAADMQAESSHRAAPPLQRRLFTADEYHRLGEAGILEDDRVELGDDILLVIEVADTSARDDRDVKGPLYARSAIAEFWLVDVVSESVEVFSQPRAEGYQSSCVVKRGERIPRSALLDINISLDDILG